MKTLLAAMLVFSLPLAAQDAAAPTQDAQDAAPAPVLNPEAQEQYELSQALGEVGQSPIDVIRVLEAHLKKYPETKERGAIEQSLAKAALDSNDDTRILLYGEKVLQQGNGKDDVTLIDRVTRLLVDSNDPGQTKKAIEYAKRYEVDLGVMRGQSPPGHLTPGQWGDELDRAMARALALEARATGNAAGDAAETAAAAEKIAMKSWETCPTGEGAREVAYWLIKQDRTQDAIEYYANAFTVEDSRTTEDDRAWDRKRMGELYSKLNGTEKGLGDVILQAYDRTAALVSERRASLKAKDPNAVAADIEDFVLPAVEEAKPPLAVSSLKGKTVVMDFWATWCGPCRAQQPLIENVKKLFEGDGDVVFVAVDTDDDTSLAAPFAKEQGWKNPGYFEGGLARQMTISSIPTVLVLDPAGRISSRMIGFIPQRFEQMLTQRIEEARKTH
jgi:thiol-disulfide isomerase/thioredoxin